MSFALNPNIVVIDFKIETLSAETTLIQDVKTDVRISRLSLIAAVLCQIQPNAFFFVFVNNKSSAVRIRNIFTHVVIAFLQLINT